MFQQEDRLTPALFTRLLRINAFLLDVEGVLTHGGEVAEVHDADERTIIIMDAHGIKAVQELGVRVGIITGGHSELVIARARELDITDIYEQNLDKMAPYRHFVGEYGLGDDEVAYMGDSVFDLPILRRVGFAATPSNAQSSVKMAAHYVASRAGGRGAVREVLDLLLRVRARTDHH